MASLPSFFRPRLTRWATALGLLPSLLTLLPPAAAQAPQALPGLPAWTWQNPRPTGYNLNDVHVFDDQNAFMVGDRGTALRTRDQGRTWQPVNLGTTNNLRAVAFASPLVGWVAYNTPAPPPNPNGPTSPIGRGEVKKTTDGGLTWATQLTGGEADGIGMKSLKFFSPTVGYVLYNLYQPGANGVLRIRWTADGGQTWTGRFLDPSVKAAQFLTPLVGYTVAAGQVSKTTDGGLTYADVTPDPVAYPNILYETLFFVDTQNGFVAGGPAGTAPNFFRTTNGGRTWTPVNGLLTPNNYYLSWRRISFADPLHGIADSYATSDGGQTWGAANGTISYSVPRLRPSGVGFSTGELGSLMVTNDFGRTRLRGDSVFMSTIAKLTFPDPVRGWAVNENGELARTDDRGVNWQRLDLRMMAPGVNWTPQSVRYTYAGAFPDADTAYAAGVESVGTFPANVDTHFVLKTVNRGQGWVRLPFASPTRVNDIEFRDGRRGLLVGDGGRCWATADGGQTWRPGRRGTTKHLQKVVWADARTAYAIGDSLAFVRTTDAGLTWQPVPTTFFTTKYNQNVWARITNIYFVSAQVGFFGDDGVPFRTTDGGITWATTSTPPMRGIPNYGTAGFHFRTPREGWAFGSVTLRTTDGGSTWRTVADLGTTLSVGQFSDPYNGWVADRNYVGLLHYSEKFITATPLAQTTHCAGGGLALVFATTGSFPATERRFAAQLSNARGRFRPGQIRVVGQGTASPLAVALPFDLPAGTRYRLRVVQADSLVLGADNGQDLTINAAPVAALTPAGPQTLCAGRTLTLTAPAGQAQYQWSTGATTRTLTVSAGGSYTVRVAGANGCLGPPSAIVVVTPAAVPATPVVQQSPGGQLSVTPLAGATYQWSTALNGAIAGATAASYPPTGAAGPGTYTVVVTSAAGCASGPSAGFVVILAIRGALPAGGGLYPNPADERLTVELAPGGGPVQLTLLDALGRTVLARTTALARTVLDVAALPVGTYWLRAVYPDGTAGTQPVQVQH